MEGQTPPCWLWTCRSSRLKLLFVKGGSDEGVGTMYWLADISRQRAYAWNLKMPHSQAGTDRFHSSGVRPNVIRFLDSLVQYHNSYSAPRIMIKIIRG